jgi:hypothetical protein
MMGDTIKPNQKQSGEKARKHHSGNMSGKTIDSVKDKSDQEDNRDRIRSEHEHTKERELTSPRQPPRLRIGAADVAVGV